MPSPQYPITLTGKKQLSDNTIQLDFEFDGAGGTGFNYIAGQFIQFFIETAGKLQKRSYSIASSPEDFKDSGKLSIALSFVEDGLASQLFANAPPGLKLQMAGPFGVLTLPKAFNGQLVLVGTGTGIAPYKAMIPQLKTLAGKGLPITVIMGVRHRHDLIYQSDFTDLSHADYRICLSREPDINSAENEYTGYVQQQFSALNLNPETDLVYLCGNPAMVDSAATGLKEAGFPSRQVKREKYVYSGH